MFVKFFVILLKKFMYGKICTYIKLLGEKMAIYSKVNSVNTHRFVETVLPGSIALNYAEENDLYKMEAHHKNSRINEIYTMLRKTENEGLVFFAAQHGYFNQIAHSKILLENKDIQQEYVNKFEQLAKYDEDLSVTAVSRYVKFAMNTDIFRILNLVDHNNNISMKIKATIGIVISRELRMLAQGESNNSLKIICNNSSVRISKYISDEAVQSISKIIRENSEILQQTMTEEEFGDSMYIPIEITAAISGFYS